MVDFNDCAHVEKCDVCGKETMVVACASTMGSVTFSYCRACLAARAEPYEHMVSYLALAGEWPQGISSAYQARVRKLLKFHGKTEEEFAGDISSFRASNAVWDSEGGEIES